MSVGFFRLFLSLYTYKRPPRPSGTPPRGTVLELKPPRPSGTPPGRGRNTASYRNYTKRTCIIAPLGEMSPRLGGDRGVFTCLNRLY